MSVRPRRLAAIKAENKCKALSHNIPLDALAHLEESEKRSSLKNANNLVKVAAKSEAALEAIKQNSTENTYNQNIVSKPSIDGKRKLKTTSKKRKLPSTDCKKDAHKDVKLNNNTRIDNSFSNKKAKVFSIRTLKNNHSRVDTVQIPISVNDDYGHDNSNAYGVKRKRGRPRKHFLVDPLYFCDNEGGILHQLDKDFSADIEEEESYDEEDDSSPDRLCPKKKPTRRKTVYTYSRRNNVPFNSLIEIQRANRLSSRFAKSLSQITICYDLLDNHDLSLECDEENPLTEDDDDNTSLQDVALPTKSLTKPRFKYAISSHINELSLDCESIGSADERESNPFIECIEEPVYSLGGEVIYSSDEFPEKKFNQDDSSQGNIYTYVSSKKDSGNTLNASPLTVTVRSKKKTDLSKSSKHSPLTVALNTSKGEFTSSALKKPVTENSNSTIASDLNSHADCEGPTNLSCRPNSRPVNRTSNNSSKTLLNNSIHQARLSVGTKKIGKQKGDKSRNTSSILKPTPAAKNTKTKTTKKKLIKKKNVTSTSTVKKCTKPSIATSNQSVILNDTSSSQVPLQEIDHQSLYNSLAKLKGNSTKKLTQELYLGIKALPSKWPNSLQKIMTSLNKLDKMLEKENYIDNSLGWLVKKEIITRPVCCKCSNPMNSSKGSYGGHESEFWVCPSPCKTIEPVNFPKVIKDSQCTSAKFAQILYRWAIRGDFNEMIGTKSSDSSISNLTLAIESIQSLCSRALARERLPLTSTDDNPVDLVSIQIVNVFIVGAMENASKSIRLDVFNSEQVSEQASKGRNIFVECAKSWIAKGSTVRISEKKFNLLEKYGYVLIPFSKIDFNNHMKARDDNIGGYLIQHLRKLFKDIDLNSIGKELLHLVLSELEWRESFGLEPYQAFLNIINHITKDSKE